MTHKRSQRLFKFDIQCRCQYGQSWSWLQFSWSNPTRLITAQFLARDAFVRTNRCTCHGVRPSVRLFATGVHCDHMVHFSVDLNLRLDSPMFWAPWHQSMSTYSQPSFSSSTWKRVRVWMGKLGEGLNATTLCLIKNTPDIFSCILNKHFLISIIFSINIR